MSIAGNPNDPPTRRRILIEWVLPVALGVGLGLALICIAITA